MSKREELVQCIGKLHEELVTNVDAREEMSADDTRCLDNVFEGASIIRRLVAAIKQLKLLDAAPCATEDSEWVRGYKAALHSYAWWIDGIQYVGCGVVTLKQALDEADAEWLRQEGGN